MFEVLPLIMMPEGVEGKVVEIRAGKGLLRRLTEMGFTENSVVKILSTNRGSLIVTVNNCKYALGKGMAMKIMVKRDL